MWCASIHKADFPTVLQRIDPEGRCDGEYWSNGFIAGVVEGSLDGRQVVVVGAANNEHKAGCVALLDPNSPVGAAPAVDPHYSCDDCPPGRPLAFVVLPKPSRFRVTDSTSAVSRIVIEPLDGLYVEAVHGCGNPPDAWEFVAQYVLNAALEPTRVDLPTGMAEQLRIAERQGKARPAGPPDRRELLPLLLWNQTAFAPVSPRKPAR